jgi:hypothetical protein
MEGFGLYKFVVAFKLAQFITRERGPDGPDFLNIYPEYIL